MARMCLCTLHEGVWFAEGTVGDVLVLCDWLSIDKNDLAHMVMGILLGYAKHGITILKIV